MTIDLTTFTPLDYTLLGVVLVLALAQIYYYARYMCAPARMLRRAAKKGTHAPETEQPAAKPGVSIVVCARNAGYLLDDYLQSLLTQDYPEYEVIVVNDGSQDHTRDVIERYMLQSPRVRTTFVPVDAYVLSTKKLAITLAAKAAKYDYLLLTDADCRPESNQWISEMMQGFANPETQIVLGFGAYYHRKGLLSKMIDYDTLFNGLHYLGDALCGHPYMGVGRNLAYRKDFFFETGGFQSMMTVRAGDDDLFVNKNATRDNTAVVLSTNSLTWSQPKRSLKEWLQQKRRHIGVSPNYRPETQIRLAAEPMVRGLWYAMLVTVVVLACLPIHLSPLVWIGTAVLALTRLILRLATINTAARRLRLRTYGPISIILLDIVLPLVSLYMLSTTPAHRNNGW